MNETHDILVNNINVLSLGIARGQCVKNQNAFRVGGITTGRKVRSQVIQGNYFCYLLFII